MSKISIIQGEFSKKLELQFAGSIILRPWSLNDKQRLAQICNSVDRRFLSDRLPHPYTENDADWWLRMVAEQDGKTGIFRALLIDDKIVGSISVEQKQDVYRLDGELGYFLLDDYWNKGVMTEAVRQMCTIAFTKLGLNRISANVFQPNVASQKVLLKNGFIQEGTMKRAVIKDNVIYDACIFGLTQ